MHGLELQQPLLRDDATCRIGGLPAAEDLHLEQVREVGLDQELHGELDRLEPVVRDVQVLMETVTDEPVPHRHDGGLTRPFRRHAEDEPGGVGVDRPGRQGLRPLPVDEQLEAGKEPRVLVEESLGAAGQHVAPGVGDEERGALNQAHRSARAHPDPCNVGPRTDPQVLRHPIVSRSSQGSGSRTRFRRHGVETWMIAPKLLLPKGFTSRTSSAHEHGCSSSTRWESSGGAGRGLSSGRFRGARSARRARPA